MNMNEFYKLVIVLLSLLIPYSVQANGNNEMIKLTLNNREVIINMQNNPASQQFLEMLPLKLEFTDFAGKEKISRFPRPVDLDKAPRGMIATAGKMFIYAPWGNLGIFYKDHSNTPDENLIELGEIKRGLNYIADQTGGFTAYLELIKR